MPYITIPQITAISLSPNPVAVNGSYDVIATVRETTVEVIVNPLFEFPMSIDSSGTEISELTW